jgi:ketosteroid isomerase-like protein
MAETSENLERVRQCLTAIERGATGDALAMYFTPDVVQEEFPNRLVPAGARRDLAAILDGAVRGQKVLSAQRFDILHTVASGDRVALEVQWTGTLAIPLGATPAGGQMRARFGVFIELRDGKICAQRNYDCFDPF